MRDDGESNTNCSDTSSAKHTSGRTRQETLKWLFGQLAPWRRGLREREEMFCHHEGPADEAEKGRPGRAGDPLWPSRPRQAGSGRLPGSAGGIISH